MNGLKTKQIKQVSCILVALWHCGVVALCHLPLIRSITSKGTFNLPAAVAGRRRRLSRRVLGFDFLLKRKGLKNGTQ
jgi:hypothetical protein